MKFNVIIKTAAVCLVCIGFDAFALSIIPGATKGFGMETPAGSGRHLGVPQTTVYKVTTLNTSGPGSLSEALEAEGPRTVVFEVSGNIDCTPYGTLFIKHPYITVAGQTAPSPGITLKGCELFISTHDVLIQHIRIRVGDLRDPTRPIVISKSGWTQWSDRDNMKIGGERVVIDHCSFSWATDENAQSRGSNLTFRHNIFSEGLLSPKHHKGPHSKGLLILKQGEGEGQNIAVYGNLFAHNTDRNPTAGAGAKIAIINNFIYGATQRPGIGSTIQNTPPSTRGGGAIASVIGNHYDKTPIMIRFISRVNEEVGKVFFSDFLYSYTDAQGKYVEEQYQDPWNAPHMKIFTKLAGNTVYPERSKVTDPPLVVAGLKIRPSSEVGQWVLETAGARPADRDPVDERVVKSVRERTGSIPESQEDVGSWPDLAENHRALTIPDNPHGDNDGDGYTNLEKWLHAYADTVEGRTGATIIDSDAKVVSESGDESEPVENVVPVADAGINQSSIVGDKVRLDGANSSDANSDSLSFQWYMVSRPTSSTSIIFDDQQTVANFIADEPGEYIVSLVVNDGIAESLPDNVNIVVTDVIAESSPVVVTDGTDESSPVVVTDGTDEGSPDDVQNTLMNTLKEAVEAVNLLHHTTFKTPCQKRLLTRSINQVLNKISRGELYEAKQRLEEAVLRNIDGCAVTGTSDEKDWIQNCSAQDTIYPLIINSIALLDKQRCLQ